MCDEVTLGRMSQVGHHRGQAIKASAKTQVMMIQDLRVADRIADLRNHPVDVWMSCRMILNDAKCGIQKYRFNQFQPK